MLKIRRQIANLFGFKNYPDYALQDKMAKNYNTAAGFTADLISKMQIKASMENDGFFKIKTGIYKRPFGHIF
jgi:Zn-dependent oligopeptidase